MALDRQDSYSRAAGAKRTSPGEASRDQVHLLIDADAELLAEELLKQFGERVAFYAKVPNFVLFSLNDRATLAIEEARDLLARRYIGRSEENPINAGLSGLD